MTPEQIASVHADLVLAGLDVVAGRFIEARKAANEAGVFAIPFGSYPPEVQRAADAVFEAREEVEQAIYDLIYDRYGIGAYVEVSTY